MYAYTTFIREKKTGYLNEYQTENNVKYFCFPQRLWHTMMIVYGDAGNSIVANEQI